MSLLIPSYKSGFARNAAKSENPNLWKGLVGLWAPSLGPTGITLRDQSSSQNHGTLTNMDPATDWVASPNGWVLDFDGGDDYVTIDGLEEDRDGSFSVSVWFKPADIANNVGIILGRGWATGYVGWALRQKNSRLTFLVPNAALNGWLANLDCQTGVLVNGTWYHIVFVKSGDVLIAYQDGEEVDRFTMASAAIGDNGRDFFIGSGTSNFEAQYWWEGQLLSVCIWNRALASSEIQSLYRDSSALLRPRRRVLVAAAAAPPGGLSIPIAMHHYTKNITAV